MTNDYALDKNGAKLMGVCSGFARWMDVDITLVRVTAVLLALFATPFVVLAYLVTAFVAENG